MQNSILFSRQVSLYLILLLIFVSLPVDTYSMRKRKVMENAKGGKSPEKEEEKPPVPPLVSDKETTGLMPRSGQFTSKNATGGKSQEIEDEKPVLKKAKVEEEESENPPVLPSVSDKETTKSMSYSSKRKRKNTTDGESQDGDDHKPILKKVKKGKKQKKRVGAGTQEGQGTLFSDNIAGLPNEIWILIFQILPLEKR